MWSIPATCLFFQNRSEMSRILQLLIAEYWKCHMLYWAAPRVIFVNLF